MINVLPYDVEISRKENNPKQETPTPNKKRAVEEGSSQPGRWVKHKATHPKLDQTLMDDEIDLITLKVGMVIDDVLTDFQKNHKQYMKEIEEHMV